MALFSKKPKLKTCWFCSEELPAEELHEHWRTHMRVVEADVGGRGFTFVCPKCGPSDQCWGAGQDDDMAYFKTAAGIEVHIAQRHGLGHSSFTVFM